MKEIKVRITDKVGIHARPASLLVKTATSYKSDIEIHHNDKITNAKSIMNVMALGVAFNDEIKITAKGDDAEDALSALKTLIESNFALA